MLSERLEIAPFGVEHLDAATALPAARHRRDRTRAPAPFHGREPREQTFLARPWVPAHRVLAASSARRADRLGRTGRMTMARLPTATRESVPEAQRDIFDELVKQLGSVPRYGPGPVMIHVPKAHRWATGLNHYLRDESSLPKKIQELAMLVTARELDCQHIWNAHAASARQAAVPNAALA